MQRRDNLTHLILAGVVLSLTLLMVVVNAQAQITFMSNRDGHVHPRLGWPTYEIYVMDADGGNQQNLTNDPNDDSSPSWSPDGKRIAFESNRDGHFNMPGGLPAYEIYVMDADGGNQQNLTNDPNSDWSPSWSPDGKRIVFNSNRDGNRDGNRNNHEIYVMDADGGNQQRLTDNDFYDTHPSWSPDGERIAFMSRRDGHFIGEDGLSSEIYVMDADGNNQRRLTNNRVYDGSPSWSSDGKRIVFSSDRDRPGQFIFEVYVMDANGGNLQNLTNNPHHTDGSPAWFGPAFAVAPAGKILTIWGRLKQVDR